MSTSTPTNAPPPDASTATTTAPATTATAPARPRWIEHWDPRTPRSGSRPGATSPAAT
jgi:hypothetical protein